MLKLHNKFIVRKTVKTTSKNFKDLQVGDIVEIEWDINQEHSRGSSSRGCYAAYVKINGKIDSAYNVNRMIRAGFELEEVTNGNT